MDKLKINSDVLSVERQRVLLYCALNGKFKNWSEIEKSNNRIIQAGDKMLKEGLLIKDSEGYIDVDYTKNPELKTIKDSFITPFFDDKEKANLVDRNKLHKLNIKKSTVKDMIDLCASAFKENK